MKNNVKKKPINSLVVSLVKIPNGISLSFRGIRWRGQKSQPFTDAHSKLKQTNKASPPMHDSEIEKTSSNEDRGND